VQCWEAHAALRRIASKNGQTILNATEGSFLDVYPTTTLGDVLAGNSLPREPAPTENYP
jgi:hypothetical protein